MCERKMNPAHWEKIPTAGTLDIAIADVMDNITNVLNEVEAREYIRQNLMALINVTRQVTAQELYRFLADHAYQELRHNAPNTVKQTLRLQREAAAALSKPSTGSSSSPGTSTTGSADPF